MNEPLTVEATGESVDEAKAHALRLLETKLGVLDLSTVRYQVLSEGERGLLGVGFEPARVVASAPAPAGQDPGSADATRLRALLTRVADACGVSCRVEVEESDSLLAGTFIGEDLGLLIGRQGQTIDALQVLAGTIVGRGAIDGRSIVVDADGYRERRRRTLETVALQAAAEALRTGARVALEPMSAAERKLVHTALEGRVDITTGSEGAEPHRYVVIDVAP